MNHIERITEILYAYEEAGLIEQNPLKVISYLADTIIGVGLGDQGLVSSKQDVLNIMAAGIKQGSVADYELSYQNVCVNLVTDLTANVSAEVIVKSTVEGQVSTSSFMQSLTLVLENNDWRICALHASPRMLSKESIEAYPLIFADDTLTQLRQELQAEAFVLANQSLSGGILGIYLGQDDYPLYFANDSAVQLLGYSQEEFYKKFKENVTLAVHAEDREAILQSSKIARENAREYEQHFRMQRKDGSLVWVIQRAKVTSDSQGRPILLMVLTDVTNMINMQKTLEEKSILFEEQAEELLQKNEELLTQKTTLQEQTRALTISEERFRIALEKTSNIIFDYDIISGNIVHSSLPKEFGLVTNIAQAKESLFIGGTIMDDYLTDFKAALLAIQNGVHQSECTLKVKLTTGREIWNKISLTGIVDLSGKAVRAIGLIEDITKQKEAEIAYAREEQYRQALLGSALAAYVINVSKNEIESCQIRDPRCVPAENGEPYGHFIAKSAKNSISSEDYTAYLTVFSRAKILEAFANEQSELRFSHLVSLSKEKTLWLESIMRLVIDGTTQDKKAFLYLMDVDQKKQAELALTYQSKIDGLTGIYNQGATKAHIQEMLEDADGLQTGVFMVLDVDYFKRINDTYGHPFGDTILIQTAKVLSSHFRSTDIVGRIGGDEFCAFFCGMRTNERIAKVAQAICENIARLFVPEAGKIGVSCSIGITRCDGTPKTFEAIYREADNALYQAKEAGRNGYAFYGKADYKKDWQWIQNDEWILEKIDAPVYICDQETHELLYMNERCLTLAETTKEQCFGQKCYTILAKSETPCSFCSINKLATDHTTDRFYRLPTTGQLFLIRGQLVNWNNRVAHLEMAIELSKTTTQMIALENNPKREQGNNLKEDVP